jgi:uncharacterized membrane protein
MATSSKDRAVVMIAYLSLFLGLGIGLPAFILLLSKKNAPSRDHVKSALIVHLTLVVLASVAYVAIVPTHDGLAVETILLVTVAALNVWMMTKSLRRMTSATVNATV